MALFFFWPKLLIAGGGYKRILGARVLVFRSVCWYGIHQRHSGVYIDLLLLSTSLVEFVHWKTVFLFEVFSLI